MRKIKILAIIFLIFSSQVNLLAILSNIYTGSTVLMNAVRSSNITSEMIVTLIKNGADPNFVDDIGRTVLIYAVNNPNITGETIVALINNGADPNFVDSGGWTVLMQAVNNSNITSEMIVTLINNGADPNLVDRGGRTVLMQAVNNPNITGETIVALINNGADPNLVDRGGRTVLMRAVGNSNITSEMIVTLINNGADPNFVDRGGRTVLMRAFGNYNMTFGIIFSLLFKYRADKNHIDNMGNTVLMHAVRNRNVSPYLIEILLEQSYDINHRNDEGKTVTDIARNSGLIEEDETIISGYLNHLSPYFSFFNRVIKQGKPEFTEIRNGEVKRIYEKFKNGFSTIDSAIDFRGSMYSLLYSRERTGDFTIIVKGKRIPVHMDILCERSGLYKGMFKFANDDSGEVIDRSGLSIAAFEALIEFIYIGEISMLSEEVIGELLDYPFAEEYFQLPEGELENFLIGR